MLLWPVASREHGAMPASPGRTRRGPGAAGSPWPSGSASAHSARVCALKRVPGGFRRAVYPSGVNGAAGDLSQWVQEAVGWTGACGEGGCARLSEPGAAQAPNGGRFPPRSVFPQGLGSVRGETRKLSYPGQPCLRRGPGPARGQWSHVLRPGGSLVLFSG